MTKAEVVKIIEDYDALFDRVTDVISDVPFYSGIDDDNITRLEIKGDDVIVTAKSYESDAEETTRFPVDALLMSGAELKALRRKAKKEEADRRARCLAAQEVVARDRREAHDRAEWARLRAKFANFEK